MKSKWLSTVLLMGLAGASLTGCQDENQQLKDRAALEAGESSRLQTEAENNNLRQRVSLMEEDLAVRHEFYQSFKGVYSGKVQTDSGEFLIRMTLVPSLPPYRSSRTRTTGEVEYDLTNLNFNVQVVQWKEGLSSAAVGCRVQGIRPDISAREMTIAAQDCPNLYQIQFKGQSIEGVIQPTTTASVYSFQAVRTSR